MSLQYVRAKVTGSLPLRDCITRDPVEPGGVVRLYPRPLGGDRPRCPRHPKKGVRKDAEACLCHTTLLEPLVESGAIELLPEQAKGKS